MTERKIIPSFDLYKTLDRKPGIECSTLEESYDPYDASQPHRHSYYEILFFREGGGIHEIDFQAYPILKNSMHFISPDQVHVLRRDKAVTGYVISFIPDFWPEKNVVADFPFFDNPDIIPIIQIPDEILLQRLLEIVSNIETEYFSAHEDKAEVLFSYLFILLITARRMYTPVVTALKHSSARTELLHRFKKAISKNFNSQKSVAYYAEVLNITPGHLNDTVQKETGKTALDMIHDRIILEARRLLYHSPKSVKEISYELGYDDPSYFVRFFRTHTHTTPELFRSEIREKYH